MQQASVRPLELQLGRMMKWQAVAFHALAPLVALSIVRIVLDALELNAAPFSVALSAALRLAALAAAGC